MNLEIERKFLLNRLPNIDFDYSFLIEQYYFKEGKKWERIRKSYCHSKIPAYFNYVLCKKNKIGKNPEVYEEEERE